MPSKRPQGAKSGRESSGKKRGSAGSSKSQYGGAKERSGSSSSRKSSYSDKRSGSFGDKKAGKSDSYRTGDRDKKFGDKKSYSGSREKSGDFDDKGYDRKKSGKSFSDRDKKFDDKKSYSGSKGGYEKKTYGDEGYKRKRSEKPFEGRDKKFGDKKPYSGSKGSYEKKTYGNEGDERKKPFGDKKFGDKKFGDKKPGSFKRKEGDEWNDRKKPGSSSYDDFGGKRAYKKSYTSSYETKKKNVDEDDLNEAIDHTEKKKSFEKKKGEYEKMIKRSEKNYGRAEKKDDGLIRLNKYLANSGVASRRDADKLIESGAVTVNGVVVTQLGTKIKPSDKVQYGGQSVKTERLVYILLNKPKDYITTMDDPQGRKTVMSLIRGAVKERVYPVGRLDRNTTGVILFTNDGELTRRLTHPKFLVSKMYHVTLDKNFSKEDLEEMRKGLELEDGYIKPDQLEYSGETKKELGIEIHSGRNRIVRRMFEHLGYDVVKLDRVQFAGLNKKDITRGKWRFLNEKEVGFLKML